MGLLCCFHRALIHSERGDVCVQVEGFLRFVSLQRRFGSICALHVGAVQGKKKGILKGCQSYLSPAVSGIYER